MAIHLVSDNTLKSSVEKRENQQLLDLSAEELQQTLRLAGLLQTSLEMDSIMAYFVEATQLSVNFDGVRYHYAPLNSQYQYGENKAHTCTYHLIIADEALGQIEFSRKKRFNEDEIITLEKLLGQLIYPLRNALWYQRALQASQHDPLTGAYNRSAMDSTLQREIELAHRNQTSLSLVILDLDNFKSINDNYGHSAGDSILKTLVTCVNSILRKSDMLFRFGGEEFTLLLSGTAQQGALQVAERVRNAIEIHNFYHNQTRISVTASLGVCTLNTGATPQSLFDNADNALYQAKQQGRNQVVVHSPPAVRQK